MDFVIKRELFLEGIQKTLGISEKKTTMAVLNNILISADSEGVKILATDQELTLWARYEAQVKSQGEVAVLARKLYELIRECQGEEISFVSSEKYLVTVTCDKAVFKIYGLAPDSYPAVSRYDGPWTEFDSDILKGLIAKTSFAVSSDEKRRNLTGVLLKTDWEDGKNMLVMVATDGNRMAYVQHVLPEGFSLDLDRGIIIPKRSLGEIRKILDKGHKVDLGLDRLGLIIKMSETILRVSVIDEQYPNYKRVIPTEFDRFVIFSRETVFPALRRMSVLADDIYNAVIIKLSNNVMSLHSVHQSLGEADDIIDVKYEGEDFELGFNVVYLIDAIGALDDQEDIVFYLGSGARKQCLLRSVTSDDCKFIVMPLKTE